MRENMDRIIRCALIGFGGMGRVYAKMIHAGLIPGLVLTGVCCRNEAGQALLRRDFANAAYVSGWEERRVTLPVDNGRYLDGLYRCQRAEAGE